MPVLGITGGVGTGKTSFTRELRGVFPAAIFDADACARELFEHDPEIQLLVRQRFGGAVFAANGKIDRSKLRDIVFGDEQQRPSLEEILHPSIRRAWLLEAEKFRSEKNWLFVDIPLLFETSAEMHFDAVVVVACSRETQQERLTTQRELTLQMAEKIIASQLPLAEKVAKAQHVIWNDGSFATLRLQSNLFAGYLIHRYG